MEQLLIEAYREVFSVLIFEEFNKQVNRLLAERGDEPGLQEIYQLRFETPLVVNTWYYGEITITHIGQRLDQSFSVKFNVELEEDFNASFQYVPMEDLLVILNALKEGKLMLEEVE